MLPPVRLFRVLRRVPPALSGEDVFVRANLAPNAGHHGLKLFADRHPALLAPLADVGGYPDEAGALEMAPPKAPKLAVPQSREDTEEDHTALAFVLDRIEERSDLVP